MILAAFLNRPSVFRVQCQFSLQTLKSLIFAQQCQQKIRCKPINNSTYQGKELKERQQHREAWLA
ncbi:MAG: hypothetical protein OQL18_08360 [Deltaproteobacteria bacterium]|nr:hypothetical protein [Deltaproteobacteria bacterium]